MAKANDREVKLPREENPHQGVGLRFGKLKERDEHKPAPARITNDLTSPFSLMSRLMEDMDQIFLGGNGNGDRRPLLARGAWAPQVETFRRGDKLVIRADLPGLKKDDVHVDIDENAITISGERCDEHEEEREGYYHSERSYGQFFRAIPLPDGVSSDVCDASFKDGVLEITCNAPKASQRRRRVEVR